MSTKSKSKNYQIDMCNGPIVTKLLLFVGPLILSSVLQLMFNAADVIVVGKFCGDNSLAAVGSVGAVTNLCCNLFLGLSIGSNVLASRYFGAREHDKFGRTLHTSMAVSVILGLILGAIGLSFAAIILRWMGSPQEVIGLATLYLRIYFLGIPAQSIYNFGSSILRSIGDTKRPMYYLTVAGIVNVILNMIFVIIFSMDVAGVAIATIVSQYISAYFVVNCLLHEEADLKLDIKLLRIDRDILLKITQVGIPASVQGILFSVSNIIIQASINGFGAAVVAGSSVSGNLEGFVYVSMNAFYQACMAFISQNVGARKYERINPILIRSEILVAITGLLMGNVMYYFRYPLMELYTDSAAVMDASAVRMLYVVVPYCLCGMMEVMVGALRGIGYALLPVIVSLIGACGLRLAWIFTLFQTPFFHKPEYLFITYPVSWAVTCTAHLICYIVVRKKFDTKMGYSKNK